MVKDLIKMLPALVASIWAQKDVVRNVCDVAIKIIDSLDGKIDWQQQTTTENNEQMK